MSNTAIDAPEADLPDEERPGTAKAVLLLIAAFALLLIPAIIGWRMANDDSSEDAATSGMDTTPVTAAGDDAVTEQLQTYNVAQGGRIVDVSSEFSDEYSAGFAIDGDQGTEWSTAGDGDDAFIVIDLGERREVTGIGFRTREMTDGSAITNGYTVRIDGGETRGPFEAGPGLVVSELQTTGQFFRIELVDTTGGNTGAVEIEIYGR